MKYLQLTGFVVAAGLAFAVNAQAADLKLGIAGPITGSNAAFGQQLVMGATQAVQVETLVMKVCALSASMSHSHDHQAAPWWCQSPTSGQAVEVKSTVMKALQAWAVCT